MRGTGGSQAWPIRLLLVLCTVAGLTAMHSLGHQALLHSHAHEHATHQADHAHHANPADTGLLGATTGTAHPASDGCGGCHGPVAQQDPSGGHQHLLDLCFAVLGGVLLLLLLRARIRRAGARTLQRSGWTVAAPPRAPPRRRLGLTLATVAVLRT